MANWKVELHEEASLELEAAFDWYLERSESAAARFLADLNGAIANVAGAPQRWPESNHGTRKFLLRRFPFAVVYRELPSSLQVVLWLMGIDVLATGDIVSKERRLK